MTTLDGGQACLRCGKTFECGMNGGGPCWCSTDFPAAMPLPASAQGCYCPSCLAALIAEKKSAALKRD